MDERGPRAKSQQRILDLPWLSSGIIENINLARNKNNPAPETLAAKDSRITSAETELYRLVTAAIKETEPTASTDANDNPSEQPLPKAD